MKKQTPQTLFDLPETPAKRPDSTAVVPVNRKRRQSSEQLEPAPIHVQVAYQQSFFGTPENTGYTLDFWEAIPKFRLTHRRYHDKAKVWETSFRWQDQKIDVEITPALIRRNPDKDDLEAVIPGPREEVVWRVLIELAAEQSMNNPVMQYPQQKEDGPFAAKVCFSLNGLRDRLADRGKAYRISEIEEALIVLNGAKCKMTLPPGITLPGVKARDFSYYLPHLHLRGAKLEDGTTATTCIALLNPIATNAILQLRCWPIDNARVLRLAMPLARWLITRLSNRYRQANEANAITGQGYHLMLSTILTESGMIPEKRTRDSIDRVREALRELTAADYFSEWKPYTEDIVYTTIGSTRQRSIIDVKWTFFPSNNLSDHIINGNKTMSARRESLARAQRANHGLANGHK
jgi:hypothetical protein